MPARMTVEGFWSRVRKAGPDECWTWNGYVNNTGYGYISFQRKLYLAHRLSFKLTHGHLPEDKVLCHACDNRRCVNPAHLWLGTRADNNADRDKKNRYRAPPPRYGEDNPVAKFSAETICAVASATGSYKDIGARFGMPASYVSEIKRGHVWSSVTGIEYKPLRQDGFCPKEKLAMDEFRRRLAGGPTMIDRQDLSQALGVANAGYILHRFKKRGWIVHHGNAVYSLPAHEGTP